MNILDLIFPKFCVGCGKLGSYLCPKCTANILQRQLFCPYCRRPSLTGATHPLCSKKYGLDGLWSLGIYQGPLASAIKKLKYKFVSDLGETLIDLMVKYGKSWEKDWVVVPVPLHPQRQRWRGFNQSALLGKILSQKIGLEYAEALKRIRNTKQQVSLNGDNRRKNVKNAFVATKSYPCVLLIDDVYTTGSTLKECAYVLKKAGAKKVWAITLAC